MKSTTTGLAPYSTDTFRHRSNSSASSCDETSRLSADDTVLCPSPYRQRSYSNASSASQSSAAQEYSQCYSVRNFTDDLNSDFDNIKLDDLSLGSDFIKEYLSPKRETTTNIEEEMICEDVTEKKESQSVTILEPRNDEMVCQSVLNNFMYNSLSNEFLEKMDERRRMMIENELTQLISRRDESGERVAPDKQKESGYDFKIKLLREELQRLDRFKSVKSTQVFNTAFAI